MAPEPRPAREQQVSPATSAAPPGPTGAVHGPPPADVPPIHSQASHHHPLRTWLLVGGGVILLVTGGYFFVPWLRTALNTVSTDDAYVNGHVTFVAPRVAGQVTKVLVDDNYRVKKGALLVQLDKEPYQVQVAIKKSAVKVAETNLAAAEAQVRSQVAQARANRYKLEHAIEQVNNQVANLRAAVATLRSQRATLELAQADLRRGEELAPGGGISKEELDRRRQSVKVNRAAVEQALQQIYAIRAGLGLPTEVASGHELSEVPANLTQTYSAVLQALGELLQSASQFGVMPTSWTASPKETIENFYRQDPEGNLNRILEQLIPKAPAIQQARAKLQEAHDDLAQAELNLRYTDIVSDIDGIVTRRNVNPGNYVQVGQGLMAVRSLTEIWIDANFKETQLADLRIGQRVRCEVDMYGSKKEYEGRITGFTMGTGQTLSLLPPQNATGNFVKIVQRLPVRIELTDYDPTKGPLFVGLSVVPYVYFKEPPAGEHAGEVLQSVYPLPQLPVDSKAPTTAP